MPRPELILPSRIEIQRPIPSSRALICATRLRCLSQAAKAGCLRPVNLSPTGKKKRMMENFNRENIVPASRHNRYAHKARAHCAFLSIVSKQRLYAGHDHKLMQIAGRLIDFSNHPAMAHPAAMRLILPRLNRFPGRCSTPVPTRRNIPPFFPHRPRDRRTARHRQSARDRGRSCAMRS